LAPSHVNVTGIGSLFGNAGLTIDSAATVVDCETRSVMTDVDAAGSPEPPPLLHAPARASATATTAVPSSRTTATLRGAARPPSPNDEAVQARRAPGASGRMVAYPDAVEVLQRLRAHGVRTAICSNWDWDLNESIEQSGLTGLVDVVVSSAWVGARKPHESIY